MSAPALPPDHSLEIAQMQQQAATEAQQRADAAAAARKEELAGLRSNANTSGRGNVSNYLTSQGLDPSAYAGDLDQYINNIMAGIAPDDPNPGSYFKNAGEGFYNQEESAFRNKNERTLNSVFAPNFAETRIPYTLDDPYINAYDAEQRSSADDIIRNMLGRHVITQTGYDAASKDLDKQGAGVRARLQAAGQGLLSGGQDKLRGIANNARSTAGQLTLGSAFDPYSYSTQADSAFTDFLNGLDSNLRAASPGNLYSTSGLAAVAGAGSGAQNTAFDPAALAGITEEPPTQPRTASTNLF